MILELSKRGMPISFFRFRVLNPIVRPVLTFVENHAITGNNFEHIYKISDKFYIYSKKVKGWNASLNRSHCFRICRVSLWLRKSIWFDQKTLLQKSSKKYQRHLSRFPANAGKRNKTKCVIHWLLTFLIRSCAPKHRNPNYVPVCSETVAIQRLSQMDTGSYNLADVNPWGRQRAHWVSKLQSWPPGGYEILSCIYISWYIIQGALNVVYPPNIGADVKLGLLWSSQVLGNIGYWKLERRKIENLGLYFSFLWWSYLT
jgi:hypothetical protein